MNPTNPMLWRHGATQWAVKQHDGTWITGPFQSKREGLKALKQARAAREYGRLARSV